MRTVSIAEANKKCKNYSGNPSEEREQQDNRHRGASPVGNGQRGKDYAQEIPYDRNKSIPACCFHPVRVAHSEYPVFFTRSPILVSKSGKTTLEDNLLRKNQKIKSKSPSRRKIYSFFSLCRI